MAAMLAPLRKAFLVANPGTPKATGTGLAKNLVRAPRIHPETPVRLHHHGQVDRRGYAIPTVLFLYVTGVSWIFLHRRYFRSLPCPTDTIRWCDRLPDGR